MSNKQTSIEWLYERLERMIPRSALYNIDKMQYFDQAKAMHKEEIIKAAIYEPFLGNYHREVGEEYYEEEFGKDQA